MTQTFTQRTLFPHPADVVFAWHARPGAFERYNPPWDPARIVRRTGTIHDGDRTELKVRVGPFRRTWIAEHRDFIPSRQFRDVQVRGPFAQWEHTPRPARRGNVGSRGGRLHRQDLHLRLR